MPVTAENSDRIASRHVWPSMLLVAALLAGGCAIRPEPLTKPELDQQIQSDRQKMFSQEKLDHPLTLPEAIARTMRFNLEQRVKSLEEMQANQQLTVTSFDMLPKLVTSAGYAGRSNHGASTSMTLPAGTPSTVPSTSQDRDRITEDLTLSWNILDLGVGYFTAHQEANRILIARERQRKIAQQLVQDVRGRFWRAASAQLLQQDVKKSIALVESALASARQAEKEGVRAPLDALQFQQNLLEHLAQLEAVEMELGSAQVELTAMINLPPGTPLQLALPREAQLKVPTWTMPMERMEETALFFNADLRESALQTRIAMDETRKAVARLLPGISFNLGRQYDSNSFLVDKAWSDAGAKVSFNLFNLLTAPSQMSLADTGLELAHARRLALRMAILAQIHIANRQFEYTKNQFSRAQMRYDVSQRIHQQVVNRQKQDAASLLELIDAQSKEILNRLKLFLSLAEMHNALGRLHATLGIDMDLGDVSRMDLPTLTERISIGMDRLTMDDAQTQQKEPPPSPKPPAKK
ncbi:MAG: TolC family protein [Magnetococcales bacterium]|nr:TolC family protein [Magnetococcales bacterium]